MIDIGKLGIWFSHNPLSITDSIAFAQQVEAYGYGALWIPEAIGREPCIWPTWRVRPLRWCSLPALPISGPVMLSLAAAQKTLVEVSENRFLLGLGVSHAPLVEGVRGHRYHKPLTYMRNYLEHMARALYDAPTSTPSPPVVLAALRSKMLTLAGEHTDVPIPTSYRPLIPVKRGRYLDPTNCSPQPRPSSWKPMPP